MRKYRIPSMGALLAFEAAARHESFTYAARELFLTESAISRQINTLESNLGVRLLDTRLRAPHILCASFPNGMAPDLPKRLAAENVHAAPRLGRLRISPHVYNDEQDVERFVEVFRKAAFK